MPNQPATPAKSFRPHPDLWALVERMARDDGVTYTAVLNRAIRDLVRKRYPYEELPPEQAPGKHEVPPEEWGTPLLQYNL